MPRTLEEEFTYHIDGDMLRFVIRMDYEHNIADITIYAHYLKPAEDPAIHIFSEDRRYEVDEKTVPIPFSQFDGKDNTTYVSFDFDDIQVTYSTALGSRILSNAILHKRIPIERARVLVESLPKGLLRYHTKTIKKGREIKTVIEK